MGILSGLAKDTNIKDQGDSVGGMQVLESGLYKMKIKFAYIGKSSGGAMSLNLQMESDKGKHLAGTIYLTSGDKKGNKHTYTDKDGDEQYLPGFNMGNSLATLTLDKDINELDTEEKMIKLWSYDAKAELPTKVDMITDLLGQDIIVGVQKQIVDKNAKDAAGNYVPTGETREQNEIDKFFRSSDQLTSTEVDNNASEPVFIKTWSDKWTGVTRDRSTGVQGTAGAPKTAAKAKPAKSLFAD